MSLATGKDLERLLDEVGVALSILGADLTISYYHTSWSVFVENLTTIGRGTHERLGEALLLALKDMGYDA